MKFRKRPVKLYDSWKIRLPVDMLCYTRSEFERRRKESFVIKEAAERGIEI